MKKTTKIFCILCMMISMINMNAFVIHAEDNQYDNIAFDIVNDVLVSYSGTDSVVTIPEGILEIGPEAFKYNTVIQEVIFPDSLAKIGAYAFYGCSNLSKADFTLNIANVESYAFANTKITDVFIPKSLKTVGYGAFKDVPIQIINFEIGITKIPDYLFSYSKLFENNTNNKLIIPDTVEEIGSSSFANCSFVKDLILPSNIKKIGYRAFENIGIQELIIPNDFCDINGSFKSCDSLTSILIQKSSELQNSRRSMDIYDAFADCVQLKTFKLESKNMSIYFNGGIFENCLRLEEVDFAADSHFGYNTLSEMFVGCTNLKELNIPSSVTYLEGLDLSSCGNVVISGYSGSVAEEWALANEIEFESLGEMITYIDFNGIEQIDIANQGELIIKALKLSVGQEHKLTYTTNDTTDTPYFYTHTTDDYYLYDDTVVAINSSNDFYITKDNYGYFEPVGVMYGDKVLNIYIGVDKGPICSISEDFIMLDQYSKWICLKEHGDFVSNDKIEWSSLDDSIAKVEVMDDSNCYVEKVGNGKTKIIATYNGENYYCDVEAITSIQDIYFKETFYNLDVNKTLKLEPIYCPENISESRELIWKSSDDTIASVNGEGMVTGKKAGDVTITATTKNGKVATCNIHIIQKIETAQFDKEIYYVGLGEQKTLKINVSPFDTNSNFVSLSGDASYLDITYDMSKHEIYVKGLQPSLDYYSPFISVDYGDGIIASCQIRVGCSPVESINIINDEMTILKGETWAVDYQLYPQNTFKGESITYTSSDESIVSCNVNGGITGIANGEAVVTLSTENGKTDTIKVFVKSKKVATINIYDEPKKEYILGEQFDLNVGSVYISYTDGTNEIIPLCNVNVDGFQPNKIGMQTIMVSYENKTTTFTINVQANQHNVENVTRIYGNDRYDTAFKTAETLKTTLGVDKFDTVIVANGTNFADALAGSYLAAKKEAPILMTDKKEKNIKALQEYIKANAKADGTVYILGGTAALPESIDKGLTGYTVKRLAGKDRYATNLLILEEAGVTNEAILVATGTGFADSLSASATGLPMLLVGKNLNADQKAFLEAHKSNDMYIIGGTAAVSAKVEKEVNAYHKTERLAGAGRYDTSVLVAETFFSNPTSAVVAYGKNFPDGLSGGPLAYAINSPLLLAENKAVKTIDAYAETVGITSGYVLGGSGLVSDASCKTIFNAKQLDFEESNNIKEDTTEEECDYTPGNSGKIFDTKEEAREWADAYMNVHYKEVYGYILLSTYDKYTINFKYR